MALHTSIVSRYDNNYVKIEISSNGKNPRFYKVPENKVDDFQKEYKKNSNHYPWISSGLILAGAIITTLPTYFLTKGMQKKGIKNFIGCLSGVIGGAGGIYLSAVLDGKSHEKLLKKYNASSVS